MNKVMILLVAIMLLGCSKEDYYNEMVIGNVKTVTIRIKSKIPTFVHVYNKIKVIKLRMDDDSEYHITYKFIGSNIIHNNSDLPRYEIIVRDGVGESWKGEYGSDGFDINFPIDKIEYFND